jgi:hypothetical protein
MFSRRSALSLAFIASLACPAAVFLVSACSSSSGSNGGTPSGDDSGTSSGGDNGSSGGSGSGSSSGGGTSSGSSGSSSSSSSSGSSGGSGSGSGSSSGGGDAGVNAATSGDAGEAEICSGLCQSFTTCAAKLDAGANQPCTCGVTGTQLLRADYVQALTSCVSTSIASNCSVIEADGGTAGVVTTCEQSVTNDIQPTPTASAFCKNLELGFCANAIPDCLAQVFTYSDPTLTAASACLPEVPDADVDGGCNAFAACLNTAFTP